MLRSYLLSFFLLLGYSACAQNQFTSFDLNIDSLFDICSKKSTTDEERIQLLRLIDKTVDQTEINYPLFRGIIYMYQAYYAPATEVRAIYHQEGAKLVSLTNQFIAVRFSSHYSHLPAY